VVADVDVVVADVVVAAVVNVVGAACATGIVSDEPDVTVTPTTSPTAARTPPAPSHGNNLDDGELGSDMGFLRLVRCISLKRTTSGRDYRAGATAFPQAIGEMRITTPAGTFSCSVRPASTRG
jgi:hypothetical protein